jgi:uncharacterized glyoxalase superfamily metalloenzyme YdcJ
MSFISKNKIRAQFLETLSNIYSEELPQYREFVEIVNASNQEFVRKNPDKKFDPLTRVREERHGAIRVGKASEMKIISRVFACFAMEPVNFYDLTAVKKPMPVISTAFRPKTKEEIDKSAFRMFVSMLYVDDERFFNDEQRKIISEKLAQRNVFDEELLGLLDIAEKQGGLTQIQADKLVAKAASALKMDCEQVIDFDLYKGFITSGNDVAADIICFNTIHINHLTPRVYDIFDVHQRLQDLGIPTIKQVQGPPRRENEEALPLLNQTSRKAPGEYIFTSKDTEILKKYHLGELVIDKARITKVEPQENEEITDYLDRVGKILESDQIVAIKHKARFGEIECRGVALTPKGRAVYDKMVANGTYVSDFPKTHADLAASGYAYYEYFKDGKITPITYEDFLPKSAAGIFASNLSGEAKEMAEKNSQTKKHQKILESAIGKKIINAYEFYAEIEENSKKSSKSNICVCKDLI